jgi:hypothetical protein
MLVSLHELLQLPVQVSVLALQQVHVLLQGIDLALAVPVAVHHTIVGEAEFVHFLSDHLYLIVNRSQAALYIVCAGGQLSVFHGFAVSEPHEV